MSTAPDFDEAAVFFPAGEETLAGVITRPRGPANGLGVVILQGGGWTPMRGRNAVYVRLARRLADEGCHVLRFDYHGVGESTGHVDGFHLDQPFCDDALAAVGALEREGVQGVALVGSCFGARTAMACADALPRLRGIVMLTPPVLDFEMGQRADALPAAAYVKRAASWRSLKRLLDARGRQQALATLRRARRAMTGRRSSPRTPAPAGGRWVSPNFSEPFRRLVDRRVPMLVLFGRDDMYLQDFELARAGGLRRPLAAGRDVVTVRTIGGRVHGWGRTSVQEEALQEAAVWLTTLAPAEGRRMLTGS